MRTAGFATLGLVGAIATLAVAAAGCGGSDCRDNGEGTCGGDLVCARNSECLPASDVRLVRITWTVRGAAASDGSCGAHPALYLLFYGVDSNDVFGYAPVPCDVGLFTIDRLPSRFVGVEIGIENGSYSVQKSFDAQGTAAFDLSP